MANVVCCLVIEVCCLQCELVSHLMISAATAGPDAKVRKMKMELAREASARPTPNLSLMRGTRMPKE